MPWEARQPASAPASPSAAANLLDEGDPGTFLLDSGGERAVGAGARAQPSNQERAPIDLDEGDPGEFVLEATGSARKSASPPAAPAAAARNAAQPHRPEPAPAPVSRTTAPGTMFQRVVIAEDTALLREVIKDVLTGNGICSQVIPCGNGEELLQLMAQGIARQAHVDLIILDVEMPVLNGYYAAVALRAFERGLGAAPIPLVFFSSLPCDDAFKRVLEYCQPARYLSKGADSMAPHIAMRLAQVLASLKH